MNKKLYRDEYHKVFGGVCAGLGEYFDMDITVVRLLFAFGFFMAGVGFIPYIILWIVLPKKGYVYPGFASPTVDYTVPPQQAGEPVNTPPFQAGNAYNFSQPVTFPPRRKSNAGIIFGMVLIFIGAAFLADEYNIIPDFDWDKLWPVVLVIIGGALIASGQKIHPWETPNWHKTAQPVNAAADDAQAADDTKTV
jgi:phage shock protein C